MKKPKTIKGYLSYLRRVAHLGVSGLKGYDKLTQEQQVTLGSISADIDNTVGEFEDLLEKEK
jgi:hypothetical protein